ncbi:putative protein [Clostridiales bacterium]|nr:MBL fold metallo-hydrolase [Clostridiales bacterium]GFI55166.1 putative protein [Clostridiales bacterium]
MKVISIPSKGYESNCWLLLEEESGTFAVIDPSPDLEQILQSIRQRNLDPKNLQYILLTHGHFDHILSVDLLRNATGAPVLIHSGDESFLTNSEHNAYSILFHRELTMQPADKLLKDQDAIPFGNTTIHVMHTPGHTQGSVCYLADNILFTGDTLFDQDIGRTDLYGGNMEQLQTSLKAIAALPDNYTVYPGHGSVTTLQKQRDYNFYLKNL